MTSFPSDSLEAREIYRLAAVDYEKRLARYLLDGPHTEKMNEELGVLVQMVWRATPPELREQIVCHNPTHDGATVSGDDPARVLTAGNLRERTAILFEATLLQNRSRGSEINAERPERHDTVENKALRKVSERTDMSDQEKELVREKILSTMRTLLRPSDVVPPLSEFERRAVVKNNRLLWVPGSRLTEMSRDGSFYRRSQATGGLVMNGTSGTAYRIMKLAEDLSRKEKVPLDYELIGLSLLGTMVFAEHHSFHEVRRGIALARPELTYHDSWDRYRFLWTRVSEATLRNNVAVDGKFPDEHAMEAYGHASSRRWGSRGPVDGARGGGLPQGDVVDRVVGGGAERAGLATDPVEVMTTSSAEHGDVVGRPGGDKSGGWVELPSSSREAGSGGVGDSRVGGWVDLSVASRREPPLIPDAWQADYRAWLDILEKDAAGVPVPALGKRPEGFPVTRGDAWGGYQGAKLDLSARLGEEVWLRERLVGGVGSSSGAERVRLAAAERATAGARERLALAESRLRAWGHDPERVTALHDEWFAASLKARPRVPGGAPGSSVTASGADRNVIRMRPSAAKQIVNIERKSRTQIIELQHSAVPQTVKVKAAGKPAEVIDVEPVASTRRIGITTSSVAQKVTIKAHPPMVMKWAADWVDVTQIQAPKYRIAWRIDEDWREQRRNLYRWDNRPPAVIFEDGFRVRDTNQLDLISYVRSGSRPAGFVSTTRNKPDDSTFSKLWNKEWLYLISAPGGIGVNASVGVRGADAACLAGPHLLWQNEVTFPGGIKRRLIVGAYRRGDRKTFHPNPYFNNS